MKNSILSLIAALSVAMVNAQTSGIVSGNTSFAIGSIAGTVQGTFEAPTGKFVFNPANLSATQIDISIAAASIFTDHKKRDSDAKGTNFRPSALHPPR